MKLTLLSRSIMIPYIFIAISKIFSQKISPVMKVLLIGTRVQVMSVVKKCSRAQNLIGVRTGYSVFFVFGCHVSTASWEMRSKTTPTHTVDRPQSKAKLSLTVSAVHSLKSRAEARITVLVKVT